MIVSEFAPNAAGFIMKCEFAGVGGWGGMFRITPTKKPTDAQPGGGPQLAAVLFKYKSSVSVCVDERMGTDKENKEGATVDATPCDGTPGVRGVASCPDTPPSSALAIAAKRSI